jgi:hypothetical protein
MTMLAPGTPTLSSVYDWAHVHVPTLAFGGAEDTLPGTAARFQERIRDLARTHPQRQWLSPPAARSRPRSRLEAPGRVLPPPIEFLKEGLEVK